MKKKLSIALVGFFMLLTSAFADDVLYGQDGHQDTTLRVSHQVGLDPAIAVRLAYFSQAPDASWFLYSAPSVGVWGVIWPPYRQRIVDTLHSLHGGDNAVVLNRRAKLAQMIATYDLSVNESHWKVGFLIHALADSFAHVHGEEGNLQSYSPIYGHIFDNGPNGEQPDKIERHPERYAQFVDTLCAALTPPEKRQQTCASRSFSSEIKPLLSQPPSSWPSMQELRAMLAKFVAKSKGDIQPLPMTEEDRTKFEAEISFGAVNAFLIDVRRELGAE